MSPGIRHVTSQITNLEFGIRGILPSGLTGAVLIAVLCVLVALWPYGLVLIVEDLIRSLMQDCRDEMERSNIVESIPYVVTIGIYFLIWFPIFLLCAPGILIGFIGKSITAK